MTICRGTGQESSRTTSVYLSAAMRQVDRAVMTGRTFKQTRSAGFMLLNYSTHHSRSLLYKYFQNTDISITQPELTAFFVLFQI